MHLCVGMKTYRRHCRSLLYLILPLFSLWCAAAALASETGHYVMGIEGIKVATLPPPGFYYKHYDVFYTTHSVKDGDGHDLHLDADIQTYVMVHRFIWMFDVPGLEADVFSDLLVPVQHTDFSLGAAGIHNSETGVGDICWEMFGMTWHKPRWDTMWSLSVFLPTGEHSRRKPAAPGKDFWTLMLSPGGTIYLDKNRLWAFSVLFRYEVHSRRRDEDVRPGHDFSFDWGLSRNIGDLWDVGIVGYGHLQVTDDSGDDVTWRKNEHDRVFGLGAEVMVYIPFLRLRCQMRQIFEFGAHDRPQGALTCLAFTKIF